MASRFEISVKEIMGETDEGLGKRVIDEMYKDDTENLSTTHSKESGGSPLDFTIFSMADLIQGKPAYGSIQDVLGNFESTLASSMSGFFGQIAESPVVNSLLPDDIHAMLTENSPNPGEDEEEDSGDGGGSTAPGNVSQTASEIISLAKNEVGYAENPPNSNNNKYAPMVGHTPGLAWCSSFISAMFKKAGHPQWQIITAGTESTLDNFMERNAVGSKPKIGALAFFLFRGGRSRGRRVNHVGIVYDWNDQYIKTVDGNAQPLWSNVLTPTGFKQMGDIRPGDAICDPDGEESKVEAVYPQGIKPIYRLTLSDGSTTYASEDHLWRVNAGFVVTTGDIIYDPTQYTITMTNRDKHKFSTVEYIGEHECQCIQVSAESGMYITDDYIPTHNTSGDNERNGGQVAKRSRPRSSVEYYAYPDFVTTGGPPSSRSGSPIGGPPSSRAGPQRG